MFPLLANAGSPLLWLTFHHLVCGNAVIGIVEGVLLRVLFRAPLRHGIPGMIAANYVSMTAGALVVSMSGGLWPGLSPRAAYWALLASVAGLWAATVVIEWPFIRWAMPKDERRWPRALRASLVVQTLSYAALVPLYLDSGPADALLRTSIVDAAEIAPTSKAQVWFLDEDGAAVWRVPLAGGAAERVADVQHAQLVADPAGRALRVTGGTASDIPVTGQIAARWTDKGFDEAAAAAAEPGRAWRIDPVYGARDWLSAEERATGRSFRLVVQTPFLWWPSRDATLLADDVVVYALGPHVVALDLRTQRLAVLGRGRNPVVTLGGAER